MVQEIGSQQDTDKHLLDKLSVGAVSPIITYNVIGLGEVAFVRWLVCRKAILPNPCYTLFVLIFCAVGINH